MSIRVAKWLRSPPLKRDGQGSTPEVGTLITFHSFRVGKMRSGYYMVEDCSRMPRSNRAQIFPFESKQAGGR
jgi:hypothetical protein